MTSKRKNMNARRRQIRRILNRHPDMFRGDSMHKLRSIRYGCGLNRGDVREFKQVDE